MPQSNSLSAKVKDAMEHRGMSRRRLARETGLDKGTVTRFLEQPELTRRSTQVAICVHLGIEVPPMNGASA